MLPWYKCVYMIKKWSLHANTYWIRIVSKIPPKILLLGTMVLTVMPLEWQKRLIAWWNNIYIRIYTSSQDRDIDSLLIIIHYMSCQIVNNYEETKKKHVKLLVINELKLIHMIMLVHNNWLGVQICHFSGSTSGH